MIETAATRRSLDNPPRMAAFRLCFPGFGTPGCSASVPCDDRGVVDLDALSEHQRNTYLGARALMGHSYGCPRIEAGDVVS